MSRPAISVLMPAFNAAEHLPAAIESVLEQTWTDFELVIVDDGSTDGTPDVLTSYDDPRIRVVRQANTGIVGALNHALRLARGPLLARMDADDVMRPERLARQREFLLAHPEVVACGTDYELFGALSGVVRSPRGPRACRARLVFGSTMAHPTAMLRAAALRRHAVTYRAEYECAEDFRLFSELALIGDLANLPYVGLDYRVHPGQISTARAERQQELTLRICGENLAAVGLAVPPERLRPMLFPTGRGRWAGVRWLVRQAPFLLWLGVRSHGWAGLRDALTVLRERLRQIVPAPDVIRSEQVHTQDV